MITMKALPPSTFDIRIEVTGDTKEEVETELNMLVLSYNPAYFPERGTVYENQYGKFHGIFSRAKSCE